MGDRKTQNEDTQLWYDGANLHADSKFADALAKYEAVTNKGAKIHFNMGLIMQEQHKPLEAVKSFTQTIEKDKYMALGFFARGIANYEAGRYEDALGDFEKALTLYRGSPMIDYTQLGMQFKLFECDVRLNAGLTCAKLRNGRDAAFFAEAANPDTHLEERHATYTKGNVASLPLFTMSSKVPFSPPANHVAALKKKKWMKESEVKAAWNGDKDISFRGDALLEKQRLEEKQKEKERKERERKKAEADKAKPPPRPSMTASALKHVAQGQGLGPSTEHEPTHIVQHEYDVAYDGDLELRMGDLITFMLDNEDGWYTGYSHRLGSYGVFPEDYIKPLPKDIMATTKPPPPPPPGMAGTVPPPPPKKDSKAKPVPPPPPKSAGASPSVSAGSSPNTAKKPPPKRQAPSLLRSTSDAPESSASFKPHRPSLPVIPPTPSSSLSSSSASSPSTAAASGQSSHIAEIVRKANERKAAWEAKGGVLPTSPPAGSDGNNPTGAGAAGVERERTMSVKERLARDRAAAGEPSKVKVAAVFGQPKAAWQHAASDATSPTLVPVVDAATAGTLSGSGALKQSSDSHLLIKVRHKDTRRLRVPADITVRALEACIAKKFNITERIELWWSDEGKATKFNGLKLSYSFKNKCGDIYCMPPGKKPVL